jgi:hypothetical protein
MPLASIADLNNAEAPELVELAKKLSTMYDDFLDNFPEHNDRLPGIHASDLSSCVRRTVYCLVATERKQSISKHWQKRFQMGHAVHAMVQNQLKRMAARENAKRFAESMALENGWHLTFEDEVKVKPELQELARYYKFHSSCDGVFSFRYSPEESPFLRVGLEIKTEAPDSFEKLKSPKGYHLDQMHIYMAALDLPLTWFFYYNKGNQNNTESNAPWLITFNPVTWQRMEGRARTALQSEATGILPDKEEGAHCEFCPWSWTCEPKHLHRDTAPRTYNNLMRRSGP